MPGKLLALALFIAPLLAAAEPNEPTQTAEPSAAVQALELEARQAALRLLEEDLEQRLTELVALREQVSAELAPGEEKSDQDLKTLISFYQAMKPKNAAVLLEKLPAQLAADVLAAMKTREAGKIFNVMSPERAVKISRLMAEGER
jgi:flagellar motility protein MotE (MotC chaperone)